MKQTKYLYRISVTNAKFGFDEAVVCSRSRNEARHMDPFHGTKITDWEELSTVWASKPQNVRVQLIGIASKKTKIGAICSSLLPD